MAFVKKIESEAGTIGIWELSEPAEQLQKKFNFTKGEKAVFETLKIEKRKKEYLAVRLLLEKMLESKPSLEYQKNGIPQLTNSSLNLSISHSDELAVVILSQKETGIDTENIFRNTENVASRFLSGTEIKTIEKSTNPALNRIIYWSAKEAVYKCAGEPEIHFNRQIKIHPFELETRGRFSAQFETNRKLRFFDLQYFFFGNNVIVSCVER